MVQVLQKCVRKDGRKKDKGNARSLRKFFLMLPDPTSNQLRVFSQMYSRKWFLAGY